MTLIGYAKPGQSPTFGRYRISAAGRYAFGSVTTM